ncbi:four helix bundle protein [Pelagicoccus albus]|uniref:Four helix bundle protein n=1 Tax=Pelagicoccus albus TaxID=415222 RepID=A0A7X1B7J6_9BACT|nr:four helix bundle protein [Pelagicoccus albus]MBC2605833.1 four helix bundle protein [Pelagicoccus albus]
MSGYRELRVWQEGKSLAVSVYEMTDDGFWKSDWGLRDQIRRAAVSVPSNIAEGEARNSQRDSVRFFQIALGSLAELSTQLEIAFEIKYIDESLHTLVQQRIENLQKSLGALVKCRSKQF